MDNILSLPVSIGEAIDKLTILDIKCDKINDERKIDVRKEYDILYDRLSVFTEKYNELYVSMKKINLLIWKQMDLLRDGNISDEEYMKLCKECIESNDIRFRIKNKINLISNSSLKEQKGYKINRLVVHLNCNDEYIDMFINPIKYFSFIYDEIIIQSQKNINLIKEIFNYDNTIKYNIDLTGMDIKQYFTFKTNTCYNVNDIYNIMNITDQHFRMF